MPCHHVDLGDGVHAIVRTANPRMRACVVCKTKTRDYVLCDGPTAPGKTCDAVLCRAHAKHVPPDSDYCPLHARAAEGRLRL